MAEPQLSESRRSLGRHALSAVLVVALLIGGSGVWAANTEITGAVVAPALVVVEGGSKLVQHPEGGVVAEILVRDDDVVAAGDLLLRLDGTTVVSNLEVVLAQLRDAFARQARLAAEANGARQLELSPLASEWSNDPGLNRLLADQERLRQSRQASLAGQFARVDEQVTQLEQQIEGLTAQRGSVSEQLAIANAEAEDIAGLYKKQLVQASRINDIKRQQAQLSGEQARLDAEIAAARASIAERRALAEQARQEFQSQVLNDLQAVNHEIAELLQRKIAAEDRLTRLEIRAPIDGVVHETTVETVGGVVRAGDTLMQIVPRQETLSLDAHVSPLDIDRLTTGQAVVLRLASLDVRTTPDLNGTIRAISPDLIAEPRTGNHFYAVRVDVPSSELAKLPPDLKLVPGMPAEVFAQTGNRTVWNYLIHPLTQQMEHAFLED